MSMNDLLRSFSVVFDLPNYILYSVIMSNTNPVIINKLLYFISKEILSKT